MDRKEKFSSLPWQFGGSEKVAQPFVQDVVRRGVLCLPRFMLARPG